MKCALHHPTLHLYIRPDSIVLETNTEYIAKVGFRH